MLMMTELRKPVSRGEKIHIMSIAQTTLGRTLGSSQAALMKVPSASCTCVDSRARQRPHRVLKARVPVT